MDGDRVWGGGSFGDGEENMVLRTCMVLQEAGATQGQRSQAAF